MILFREIRIQFKTQDRKITKRMAMMTDFEISLPMKNDLAGKQQTQMLAAV